MKSRADGALVATAATVAVCTQPATTSTTPCSPLATLYTDATLATPCTGTLKDGSVAGATNCSNPLVTDAKGNYHFYAATTVPYTLQVYGSGLITSVESDITVPCNGGNCALGSVTLGTLNRQRWNCANGLGYTFSTIEGALSDISTNSTQGGFVGTCPDNTTDTFATQNEIGSATKTAAVNLHPGNNWTCKVTTGGTSYCWGLHNGSSLFGANNGTQGALAGLRTGGAYLYYDCTAKTSYGLTTPEGIGGTQGYAMFKNIFMEGCPTGTVAGGGSPSVALFNWQGISSMNELANFQINGCANTICGRFASDSTSINNVLGPIVVTNGWFDAAGRTGGIPLVVTNAGNTAVLPMTFTGGVANHPGTTQDAFFIDSTAGAGNSWGGSVTGMYLEDLADGNHKMFHLTDANNWMFNAVGVYSVTGDTGFDISQDAVGRSCAMQINNFRIRQGTGINNHISGYNSGTSFVYFPFYHFGGDSSCLIAPFIVDSNQVQILNSKRGASNVALLMKNNSDSEQDFDNDSGTSAGQTTLSRYLDRGTYEWGFGKDGANNALIKDGLNNHVHFQAIQNGANSIEAWGSNGNFFNDQPNTAGPPARFYSGGASPAEVTRITTQGTLESRGSGAVLTGTGACATITTQTGGAWAGRATCTGTTGASTLTIAPGNTAPNGFVCNVQDMTNRANLFQQTSTGTASCTLTVTSVTQNDVFVFTAFAF